MDVEETAVKGTRFLEFTIQVNASPYAGAAAEHAYRFAQAALARGHKVRRVFFYGEGVYHALKVSPPADEFNLVARWSQLAMSYGVDLVICSAAAQRRGVWEPQTQDELIPGFRIAGLALLVESVLETDRLLVFG
ncbi:MAG: sulfurtransferase complex subunit TusD [Methylohalobius sp.]|nr:sulfurtransferase complex subunit TusD [Methylohalobius sp.]